MKTITLFLFILSFSLQTFSAELRALPLKESRVLAYEASLSSQKHEPVFIFMPGIFRGFQQSEKFLQELKAQNISFVTFHFAEQPASVALTGSQRPDFSRLEAADLAQEVTALADELQIENAIPVSISYSAIVTQHLDRARFPVVVETSPIGKATDNLSESLVALYEAWAAWLKLFPYGDVWVEQNKQFQLRQYWNPIVFGYSRQIPELRKFEYHERAVQGYIALTRASEGFALENQDFAEGPRRYFVLGENEAPHRLKMQKQALLKYQQETGHENSVFILPRAGHIVPNDEPTGYVKVLREIRDRVRNEAQSPAPVQ